MFSHIRSIFGRKPRVVSVIDATAQCKVVSFNTPGSSVGILVAEIKASVKDPVFVEFIGYIEEVFTDAATAIVVGTTTPAGAQIMNAGDIAELAVGFTAVIRKWFTANTKVYVSFGILTNTAGKFRLFITAKGSDSRGN